MRPVKNVPMQAADATNVIRDALLLGGYDRVMAIDDAG